MQNFHKESLEEEATHVTDEARMVLPGVQAILGFQLIAVFNQLHLAAFFLLAAAMGMIMTPAAYHRQAERGCVTRRFVTLGSFLLTVALGPLVLAVAIDAYLLTWLVVGRELPSLCVAGAVLGLLGGLWFLLPQAARRTRDSRWEDAQTTSRGSEVQRGQHAAKTVG
jgi:hypothetical protein